MENLGYLFVAYIVIWGLLFGYLVSLSHRTRSLRRKLQALERETRKKK